MGNASGIRKSHIDKKKYLKRIKKGIRGIIRGFLFTLIIALTLFVFPWVLRRQFKRLERSCNTELWYLNNPSIAPYISFGNDTNCKYCRNATKLCPTKKEDGTSGEVAYFVLSYVKNQCQRHTIRSTWASSTSMQPVFVMGIHPDEAEMILAAKEAEDFGDMIIESFADTFENSTLKTASILKHFKKFCGNVSYLMKTEDDVLVNTHIVEKAVRKHINNTLGDLKIIGYMYYDARVVRNIKSLWYVGHSLQKNLRYPTYASRRGYLIPGNKVESILDKALEVPMIPVEDAYFTGLVASAVGLNHLMDSTFDAEAIGVKHYCTIKSQSLIYAPNPRVMGRLWSSLQTNNPSICFTFWNTLIIKLFT